MCTAVLSCRMLAAIIHENFLHGRTKAIWVSQSNDLLMDAKRDLNDIGAAHINVHGMINVSIAKVIVPHVHQRFLINSSFSSERFNMEKSIRPQTIISATEWFSRLINHWLLRIAGAVAENTHHDWGKSSTGAAKILTGQSFLTSATKQKSWSAKKVVLLTRLRPSNSCKTDCRFREWCMHRQPVTIHFAFD